MTGGVHELTPDPPSVAEKATSTGCEYQPFASGLRAMAAVTAGAVASYRKPNDHVELTLPALSWHVPETLADALSGPEYVADEHVAMPDVVSFPVNASATGWLYQPPPSGAR